MLIAMTLLHTIIIAKVIDCVFIGLVKKSVCFFSVK